MGPMFGSSVLNPEIYVHHCEWSSTPECLPPSDWLPLPFYFTRVKTDLPKAQAHSLPYGRSLRNPRTLGVPCPPPSGDSPSREPLRDPSRGGCIVRSPGWVTQTGIMIVPLVLLLYWSRTVALQLGQRTALRVTSPREDEMQPWMDIAPTCAFASHQPIPLSAAAAVPPPFPLGSLAEFRHGRRRRAARRPASVVHHPPRSGWSAAIPACASLRALRFCGPLEAPAGSVQYRRVNAYKLQALRLALYALPLPAISQSPYL